MSKDLEMMKRYTAVVYNEGRYMYVSNTFYRKDKGEVLTDNLIKAVTVKESCVPDLEKYMANKFDGSDWDIKEVLIAITSPSDYLSPLYDLSKMCKQKDKDLKESNVVINRLLKEAEGYALTIESLKNTISDLQADVQNIEDLKLKLSSLERDQIDKALLNRLEKDLADMADQNSILVRRHSIEVADLRGQVLYYKEELRSCQEMQALTIESHDEVVDNLYDIQASVKDAQDMLNTLISDLTEFD